MKKLPKFKYLEYKGKQRQTYFPDFKIKENIIVEVKDVTSAGLKGTGYFHIPSKVLWYTLLRKAKAVEDAGYKFKLLVFNKNEYVKMPKDWKSMKYKEIRKWYEMYLDSKNKEITK